MESDRPQVYIVDDDRELCASLSWLLDSVGIKSESFYSVQSFLDGYRGDVPACLVLDVRMPEVGGFALQERLLADEEETTLVIGSWTYQGTGWTRSGDQALALAAAGRAREYAQWKAEQSRWTA